MFGVVFLGFYLNTKERKIRHFPQEPPPEEIPESSNSHSLLEFYELQQRAGEVTDFVTQIASDRTGHRTRGRSTSRRKRSLAKKRRKT